MSLLVANGWLIVNGDQEYREFIIDLDQVKYIAEYEDPSGGETSLFVIDKDLAINLDLTVKEAYKVFDAYKENKWKNFHTVPKNKLEDDPFADPDEMPKGVKKWKKYGQKE